MAMKTQRIRLLRCGAVAVALAVVAVGCGQQSGQAGVGERTGVAIDKAAAKTKDAAGQAVEKTGEALEKAGSAVDKTGTKMQK